MVIIMALFAIMTALILMAVDVSGQNRDGVVFSDQSCTTIGEIGDNLPESRLHNEA